MICMSNFKEFYVDNFAASCTSFKGRLTRRGYMVASLLLAITTTPLLLISVAIMFLFNSVVLTSMAFFVTTILALVMGLSINVRRLHDLDFPGIALLFMFVPLVNIFLTLAMFSVRGTVGANKYGESNLPDDIGESYVMNGERISLITCLPTYLMQNIYSKYRNNLFSTSSRADRREYFIKIAGTFVIYQLIAVGLSILQLFTKAEELFAVVTILSFFVTAVLIFIADIRRSHDLGRSWVRSLLFIIPLVNFWHIARQMTTHGSSAANEYGECTVPLDENGVPMDDF